MRIFVQRKTQIDGDQLRSRFSTRNGERRRRRSVVQSLRSACAPDLILRNPGPTVELEITAPCIRSIDERQAQVNESSFGRTTTGIPRKRSEIERWRECPAIAERHVVSCAQRKRVSAEKRTRAIVSFSGLVEGILRVETEAGVQTVRRTRMRE